MAVSLAIASPLPNAVPGTSSLSLFLSFFLTFLTQQGTADTDREVDSTESTDDLTPLIEFWNTKINGNE